MRLRRRDRSLESWQASIDRYLDAGSPREARDAVLADERLLERPFDDWMRDSVISLRQHGDARGAEIMQFQRSVVQRFREEGVQAGYLGLVAEQLAHAEHDEAERIVAENPDITTPAAIRTLRQRADDLDASGHREMATIYRAAAAVGEVDRSQGRHVVMVSSEDYPHILPLIRELLADPSPRSRRRRLEAHPDLLEPPGVALLQTGLDSLIARAADAGELHDAQRLKDIQAVVTQRTGWPGGRDR